MISAAETEYSRDFRERSSLPCDFAFLPRRRENDLRKFPALQDFRVHFLVPRCVVGVGACGVHNHTTAGIAGFGIEDDVAALQLEKTMNGVHRSTEREFDRSASGIEINGRLLRIHSR